MGCRLDLHKINGNYNVKVSNIKGDDQIISQNNLQTGIILSNSNNHFENRRSDQKASLEYMFNKDTTSTFKIFTDGTSANNMNDRNGNSEQYRGDSSLLTKSENFYNSNNDFYNYNLNLSWQKKLKKYGRTISFYFNNNFSNNKSNGTNHSKSTFYDQRGIQGDSTVLLQLEQKTNDNSRTNSFNAIYTEMLSPKVSLAINYTLDKNVLNLNKRSYDMVEDSSTILNDDFSTILEANILGNEGGASINYTLKKITVKAGANLKFIDLDLKNRLERKFQTKFPKS